MQQIPKSQVLERIRHENPWWITGKIDEDFSNMQRRPYFELFKPLALEREIRRALVLMGPRRVGKTVMLYHTIEELIDTGINPKKIIFITIENPIYNYIALDSLFNYAKEAAGLPEETNWYVIFDEIQYCKEWEVHLKSLVDTYRKDKFIVSGSAAAALKYKSDESGAGRFTNFLLPPLTFHEYLVMKGQDHIFTEVQFGSRTFYRSMHNSHLNELFINYINYGGYPEVIFSERVQKFADRYLKSDVIDKVLLKDLPSLYGISDTVELNTLFTSIAYNTGQEFSLETLSKNSYVSKHILKKYVEYLDAAFLIKKVQRVDHNSKRFKRDNFFKLYLTNPSIRSALFAPINVSDDLIGSLVETAIFSQWMHHGNNVPWYAKWTSHGGGEVDMVMLDQLNLKPKWAVEIKWSNAYYDTPSKLKSLRRYCHENNLKYGFVTTIDKEGYKKVDDITLVYFPAAAYAYTVGKNMLEDMA